MRRMPGQADAVSRDGERVGNSNTKSARTEIATHHNRGGSGKDDSPASAQTSRAAQNSGSDSAVLFGELSTDDVCKDLRVCGFSAEGSMREVLLRWLVIRELGPDVLHQIDWSTFKSLQELPPEDTNCIKRLADALPVSDRSVVKVERFLLQARRPSRRRKSKAEIALLEEAEKLMGLGDLSIDDQLDGDANLETIVQCVYEALGPKCPALAPLLGKGEGRNVAVSVRCIRRVLEGLQTRLKARNELRERHWPSKLDAGAKDIPGLLKLSASLDHLEDTLSFDEQTEFVMEWLLATSRESVTLEAEKTKDPFAFRDHWFAKFLSYLKVGGHIPHSLTADTTQTGRVLQTSQSPRGNHRG
jgi:hypothetical protein